jgi:hypothetical protein
MLTPDLPHNENYCSFMNPIDMVAKSGIIYVMNRKHRKTLEEIFADPLSGNIEWRRIEALFKAVGCKIIEGSGSRITMVHEGRKAGFHRPHPGKEALRYRVSAARDFLEMIGVTP